METKFQSSFIPKQPVNEPVRSRPYGSNLFFLISFLILVASLVGSGVAYLYNQKLDNQIVSARNDLDNARKAFDQNTIKDFSRLNDKLNVSAILLRQHTAPSILFKVIGDVTLKNTRFSSFSYSNAGGDKVSISMSGESISYEAVAVQAAAFTNPKLRNVFRNTIFSDPDLTGEGKATFTFSAGIDPNLLNYYKLRSTPEDQVFQNVGLKNYFYNNAANGWVSTGGNSLGGSRSGSASSSVDIGNDLNLNQ